jgi:hypothetical protein
MDYKYVIAALVVLIVVFIVIVNGREKQHIKLYKQIHEKMKANELSLDQFKELTGLDETKYISLRQLYNSSDVTEDDYKKLLAQ